MWHWILDDNHWMNNLHEDLNYAESEEEKDMSKKDISEIEKEVDEMLSTEEGIEEFGRQLSSYCYDMLNENQKKLFQQMMNNFDDITEDEMNSGLSIIFMNYPSAGNYDGTYNYIIKEHSKLFEDWIPNRVEKWVAFKITE